MSLVDVGRHREIAEVEFADIVAEASIPGINELRIILGDGSFVDVLAETSRPLQFPLGTSGH